MNIKRRLAIPISGAIFLVLAACAPPSAPIPGTAPSGTEAPTPTTAAQPSPIQETPTTGNPTARPELPDTGEDLAGTRWRLESLGPPGEETPASAGANVTLEFAAEGRAGGSGGCNTYGGPYTVENGSLTFGPLASTRKACVDQGVMELEAQYLAALQAVSEFELAGDSLTLTSAGGQSVLNFVRLEDGAQETPEPALLCSDPGEGADPGWQVCRSLAYGFEVQVPDAASLLTQTASQARFDLPFTPDTNLTEKYLEITVMEEAEPCSSPLSAGYPPGDIPREPVQVGNLEFIKETGQEGAAGSVYTWEAYSITRDDLCASLSFVLRSTQPELEPTPPPSYDPDEEQAIFTEILATFRWLEESD